MTFNKIAIMAVLATATTAAMGQSLTTRVFTYDGSVFTNGTATYILNGDGPGAVIFSGAVNGLYPNNGVVGASTTNVAFLVQTLIFVSSYVYISGNFGGVYTVQGIGSGTDVVQTNLIEVRTNRSLTFTATGFFPLIAGVGSIAYGMSVLQDFPNNGTVVSGPVGGVDGLFNGQTVGLNAITSLPPDGRATLKLTRQLTLTQAALGGHEYAAAGLIQVNVN
jgi:hypothetical protein